MDSQTLGMDRTRRLRTVLEGIKQTMDTQEQSLIRNYSYLQNGSRSRLRTVRYGQVREIERIESLMEDFFTNDLEKIFQEGLGEDLVSTPALRRELNLQRGRARRKHRAAVAKAKSQSLRIDRLHNKSRSQVRAVLNSGVVRPVAKGRGGIKMASYSTMVARTEAQKAYTLGIITRAEKDGFNALVCSDGSDCGLTSHLDPRKVSGELFNFEEARRYQLAHPNCQRMFRPVKRKKPPENIVGTKRSSQMANKWYKQVAEADALLGVDPQAIAQASAGFADFTVRLGAELASRIDVEWTNLAADLVLDAATREVAMNAIIKGHRAISGFPVRIRNLAKRNAFDGDLQPTEDEIAARVAEYIDQLSEGVKAPEWVYQILDAKAPARLKVVGGDYDDFMNVRFSSQATHAELNMRNSLEAHYGSFFESRLSAAHPNLAGRLEDLYKETARRYSEPRFTTGDRSFVSVPRLGGNAYRGPRFSWSSRPIKFQTTGVNSYRAADKPKLKSLAHLRGLSPPAGATRQQLIDLMGYKPGLLSHVTINPGGAFRMGLRISSDGWLQPDFRIIPTTVPLRYTARINRGRLIDGYRIRSISQEVRLVTPRANLNLPNGGRLDLGAVGVSTRTMLGRVDNAQDLSTLYRNYRTGTLQNQTLPTLRSSARFLTNLSTSDIAKLSKTELIAALEEAGGGLSGWELLMRNTEILNLFAEMRLLGYNRWSIARTFRISADQAQEMIDGLKVLYGPTWREGSMALFMRNASTQLADRAQSGFEYTMINVRSKVQSAVEYINNSESVWQDLRLFMAETFPRTFIGKAYEDFKALPVFFQEFKAGIGRELVNLNRLNVADLPSILTKRAQQLARSVGVNIKGASMLVKDILSDAAVYAAAKAQDPVATAQAVGRVIVARYQKVLKALQKTDESIAANMPLVNEPTRRRLSEMRVQLQYEISEIKRAISEIDTRGYFTKPNDDVIDGGNFNNVIEVDFNLKEPNK